MQKALKTIAFCIILCIEGVCQEINYTEHIAPIIEKNCVTCHAPGEIGPMPLTNYDEVASYASMIQFVTSTSYMPPWLPEKGYGAFKLERRLSDEQISKIEDWIDGGLEEGPKSDEEVKNRIVKTLKDPDLVIGMSESFEQYGVYYDQYRSFVIPTNLNEDKWITSLEFVPGNRDIVRSVTISLDRSLQSDSLDQWDPKYGYYHFGGIGYVPEEYVWYHWTPGMDITEFEEEYGKFLPKGSRLIFHITYGPTGEAQMDSSFLKVNFIDHEKIRKRVKSYSLINDQVLTNPPFTVPKGEVKRFHAKFQLDHDFELMSIMPHSQLLCKSWEIFAIKPGDRTPVKLLKISDWDFHWKQNYELKEPIILLAGTIIHAHAMYDNTSSNLNNPADPPIEMKSGFGMFEELFLVHFTGVMGE